MADVCVVTMETRRRRRATSLRHHGFCRGSDGVNKCQEPMISYKVSLVGSSEESYMEWSFNRAAQRKSSLP